MRNAPKTVRANVACDRIRKSGCGDFGGEGSREIGLDEKVGDNAEEKDDKAHHARDPSKSDLWGQRLQE